MFWSGDPVRAAILKANGVTAAYQSQCCDLPEQFSDPDGHWTGFSARARVLVYNRGQVSDAAPPTSVMDLLAPRFARRACLANPLFGTTSMHAAALFEALGDAGAGGFLDRYIDNGGRIVSSNGAAGIPVSTRSKSGSGARQRVRYMSRKGSQFSERPSGGAPVAFSLLPASATATTPSSTQVQATAWFLDSTGAALTALLKCARNLALR